MPTAIHRRPMCFAPGEKSQGEEMSATFLDGCAWQTLRSTHCSGWGW